MRSLLLIQASLIVVGTAIFSVESWQASISFVAGGLVMLANVLILSAICGGLLRKKLIALGVAIIVSKYALLGFTIYKLMSISWFDHVAFMVGISLFAVAAVIYSMLTPRKFSEVQGHA
ncbi:MAG: hypothetical protein C5B49_05510 [Bdellovibrio sp.]|nr:MAG: hypothetical protein C5B49_05510 [Bdellovibrio sp.]